MPRHQELADEAEAAYRASRMPEAALQYRQAAQAALDSGERAAWFRYIVWAAVATSLSGDLRGALSLLLSARLAESEDAPWLERWIARISLFTITLDTRPALARLEELLAELRACAQQQRAPAADIPYLEGELHYARGAWAGALQCYERAWQDHDGSGYLHSSSAYEAALCCLRLGLNAAAADWLTAMAGAGNDAHAGVGGQQAELALQLALATAQPPRILAERLDRYTALLLPLQRRDTADDLRELTARAALLMPGEGDPAARDHRARQELRRRWRNTQSDIARYNARLLLLDYRLACLRHGAALPALDDFYYATPQQAPARFAPTPEHRRRLAQARAAVGWAMRQAVHLDNLLACDWRQREVQNRAARIDEIAASFLD